MNDFQALISGGMRELIGQAGVSLRVPRWRATIPALQGSGISYESVIDGGMLDNENPSFSILLADIPAGKEFTQGLKVCVGDREFKVKTVSFDPADPAIRITTEGVAQ